MLTIKDRSDLQQLKADLPPVQQLFESQQAAHDDFVRNAVGPALAEAKAAGFYPDEKLFLESMKTVWLEVYSRYAPRDETKGA